MKMTQTEIYYEYEKLMQRKATIIKKLHGIGAELSVLQATCTHPNKIVYKSYTAPTEYCVHEYENVRCPDCGYFSRKYVKEFAI